MSSLEKKEPKEDLKEIKPENKTVKEKKRMVTVYWRGGKKRMTEKAYKESLVKK